MIPLPFLGRNQSFAVLGWSAFVAVIYFAPPLPQVCANASALTCFFVHIILCGLAVLFFATPLYLILAGLNYAQKQPAPLQSDPAVPVPTTIVPLSSQDFIRQT